MKKIMIVLGIVGIALIGYGIVNPPKEAEEVVAEAPQVEEEEAKADEEEKTEINDDIDKSEVVNEFIKEKRETIVLDPGHSITPAPGTEPIEPGAATQKAKDAVGAVGVNSKVNEYKITHDIGNLLKEDLEKRGFNVVMTKTKPEEQRSNIERAEIGNKENAALLIRIHADSFSNSSATGASMLVPAKSVKSTAAIADLSRKYGQTILDSYISKVPIKSRGIIERNDLTGFNWSKVPVVLIEMGYLSNPNEDAFMTNPDNYGKIVEGIGEGIDKCFQ